MEVQALIDWFLSLSWWQILLILWAFFAVVCCVSLYIVAAHSPHEDELWPEIEPIETDHIDELANITRSAGV